jgi:E3 ubiquitin-protein ligase TRIP12
LSISESEEQGDAPSGLGLGGGLADMTVMQNLTHRPKDQVEEALKLVSQASSTAPERYAEPPACRLIQADLLV